MSSPSSSKQVNAILHHPDTIPSNDEAALSPTEMPFTEEDFYPQMETAIELMDMLGDAEIKYAINGLLSLTPDGMPCLGEIPDVENLWSAAAVWVKEGPGMGQVVAEWMTYGYPRVIDSHGAEVAFPTSTVHLAGAVPTGAVEPTTPRQLE